VWVVVGLLIAWRASVLATVILPADFTTVVGGADLIVAGRVVDVRSQLSGERAIESFITVRVADTLKGAPRDVVTVRVPGGTVGRYRRITIGAPEFVDGDRVVLFLRTRTVAIPTLFGLSQGVYRVATTSAGDVVLPAPVLARGVSAERVVRGDPARAPLPLAEFLRQVRSLVEAR
jgi:hypothetical protein